ncbi:MAG: FHA domain-containing protein, partial [Deltaproteobacteria bacterium]|nr:FHA domain-containing protein [Deltaproteobacteria bacterium]
MARISFIGDNGEPLEMVVGPDNPEVLVGRHRSCAIRTSTQSVSRQHARIFYDGERYWLQDNGSSNGTYYKNERLRPQDAVEVEDGEFFMCGNFEMRFDLDEEDLRLLAQQRDGGYADTLEAYEEDEEPYGDPDATQFAEAYDEPLEDADDWGYEPPPA